jgi:hypothetical protein
MFKKSGIVNYMCDFSFLENIKSSKKLIRWTRTKCFYIGKMISDNLKTQHEFLQYHLFIIKKK